jgi:chemotaxis signal transduction protein
MALRGEIVEVVDLRQRLGIEASKPGRSSRIIVLHGDATSVTGVLVDSVSGVYQAGEESILPTEEFESGSVVEMCRRGDEFVSILAVDRILGFADA